MPNPIFGSFLNLPTKVGEVEPPEYTVKISNCYGYAATRAETMVMTTGTGGGYVFSPEVRVKMVRPLIRIEATGLAFEDGDRWFLRKADAVSYIIGLRMSIEGVQGVEEALKALE